MAWARNPDQPYTIGQLIRMVDLDSFETMANNLQLLLIMIDSDMKLQYGNKNFFELVGWNPEEVLDKDYVKQFIPPKTNLFVRATVKDILTKNTTNYSGSNEVLTRNKGIRYINWNAIHVLDHSGEIRGIFCIGIDITERKSLDSILTRVDLEKNLLLHNISEPVLYHDPEGRISWANQALLEVTGTSLELVIGSYCHQLFEFLDGTYLGSGPPRALPIGEKQEAVVSLGDGSRWLSTSYPLRADDINPYQIMMMLSPLDAGERSPAAVREREEDKEGESFKPFLRLTGRDEEVGFFSPQMKEIVERAGLIHADRTVPVLIEGETGVGKEIIARYIHHGARGSQRPFIDINCAAITPTIFESELFGYEGGAFTGCRPGGQKGKIAMADGGTLFLDEIAEIPPSIQAKLLRVIQEREYYPVGGLNKRGADVRLICATNANLEECVRRGSFRKDLFYRLEAIRIAIPPLRRRREDILPLAMLFLDCLARKKGKRFRSISPQAQEMLLACPWPGNVRQLRNLIERAVVMWDEQELRPEHLSLPGPQEEQEDDRSPGAEAEPGLETLPPRHLDLQELNRRIILRALEMHGGNITETAAYLGMSRRSLSYRLKKMRSAPGGSGTGR